MTKILISQYRANKCWPGIYKIGGIEISISQSELTILYKGDLKKYCRDFFKKTLSYKNPLDFLSL
jgi:hypothetical protein